MALLRLLWLLGLMALLGCASTSRPPPVLAILPRATIRAVALYPFGFRWSEPSYRSIELSSRLYTGVEEGLGEKVLLFAPPDVKVYKTRHDNLWESSSLVSVLNAHGLKPEDALILRPWAERRASTLSNQVRSRSGKDEGNATVEEVVYVGHVEVLHRSTKSLLFEASGQVKVDPFARGVDDEVDPTPALTKLMEALTREAVRAIAALPFPPTGPSRPSLTYRVQPLAQVLAYSEAGRPSLEKELGRKDPLEADILKMGRVRFANPTMSDSDAVKLLRLPGGLWLRRGSGDGMLQSGDLILTVDGAPATPQALQRARFKRASALLKVQRAKGTTEEVRWPPPEAPAVPAKKPGAVANSQKQVTVRDASPGR